MYNPDEHFTDCPCRLCHPRPFRTQEPTMTATDATATISANTLELASLALYAKRQKLAGIRGEIAMMTPHRRTTDIDRQIDAVQRAIDELHIVRKR